MSHARTTITALLLAVATVGGTGNTGHVETTSPASTAPETVEQRTRWVFDEELPGCDAVSQRTVHRPGEADCPRRVELGRATVYMDDPDRVAEVEKVLDAFAAAGLELPHVSLWLVASEDCSQIGDGDMPAGFTRNLESGSGVFSCGTEFTLVHELGHVWDHHVLDDADRERFLALRGLTEWHTEWQESGAEHAADVLALGLTSDHRRPSRTLPNDDESLTAAFVALTGRQPLP